MFLQVSVILLTGGVHGPGGCMVLGGAWSRGVHGPGGAWSQGVHGLGVHGLGGGAWSLGAWWRPPPTATAAVGTHPTGMHSYLVMFSTKIGQMIGWRPRTLGIGVPLLIEASEMTLIFP